MKKLLILCFNVSLFSFSNAASNIYTVVTNVTIINNSSCTLTNINSGAHYQAQWEALTPTKIKPNTKSSGYTLKYQYSDSWSDDGNIATLTFKCNDTSYAIRAAGKYYDNKTIPQTSMYVSFTDPENNQINYGLAYKKLEINKITNSNGTMRPNIKSGIEISGYNPFIKPTHCDEAYIYITDNK